MKVTEIILDIDGNWVYKEFDGFSGTTYIIRDDTNVYEYSPNNYTLRGEIKNNRLSALTNGP